MCREIYEKSKTKTQTLNKTKINYNLVLAYSLLEYLKKNTELVSDFKKRLQDIELNPNLKPQIFDFELNLLMPQDNISALERFQWLVERGDEDILPILKAGVMNFSETSPKQIVIGIVGLAIPGPTLGIIRKRKKMSVVLRPEARSVEAIKLGAKISQASHEVFKKSLQRVSNKVDKLDPDMSDWFFGDKEINFYQADLKKIDQIKTQLKELDVSYATVKDQAGDLVLAISPVVNYHYHEILWDLERI